MSLFHFVQKPSLEPLEKRFDKLKKNGEIKVITYSTKEDVTKALQTHSAKLVEQISSMRLCGFILKSKSPTCGMERVKVYAPDHIYNAKKGKGLFASKLNEENPFLPMEEDGRLHDEWLRENFFMQIFAYRAFFEFYERCESMKALVEFHTSYKYLIYSKSTSHYKACGKVVANMNKKPLEEVKNEYKLLFLEAIALKSSVKKTYNVLQHILGYFKKLISKEEKQEILESMNEFKVGLIPLIAVIKIINLYVKRFEHSYLTQQTFLNPYPKELALRSGLKAVR